jgi:hypothetical protein
MTHRTAADVADAKSTNLFDLLVGEPQLLLGDSLVGVRLLGGAFRFVERELDPRIKFYGPRNIE